MKILFFFGWSFAETGGTQRAVLAIGSGLTELGHAVTVLSDHACVAEPFYPYNSELKIQHLHHVYDGDLSTFSKSNYNTQENEPRRKRSVSRILQLYSRFYRKKRWHRRIRQRLPALREVLEKEKPDVCIAFTPDYLSILRHAMPDRGFPVVLALRNAPEYFSDAAAGNPENLIAKRNFADHLAEADGYTVLIPAYLDAIKGFSNKPQAVIPNGIRVSGASEQASKGKSIVYTSRFDTQKRPEWLMLAFAQIADKYPDWVLDMYGSGTDGAAAHRLVASLGLEDRIRLHGPVSDLRNAYQNAAIFCLPSSREGFSNSLAEAMGHSLACVAIDDCVSNVHLLANDAGLLSSAHLGWEGLAETLDCLLSDPDLQRRLGEAAHRRIQGYTPEKVAFQWHTFLQQVKRVYEKNTDCTHLEDV